MAKRIGNLIFILAIIVTGIVAFNKLHYWEQSIRILSVNKEQSFRRGGERYRSGFDRDERHDRSERWNRQNLRNSRDENRGSRFDEGQTLVLSDSLNQSENTQTDRSSFRGGDFSRYEPHRGGSRRNNNIHLENAGWFLAAFSMFTVVTIYIDKIIKRMRSGFFRKGVALTF